MRVTASAEFDALKRDLESMADRSHDLRDVWRDMTEMWEDRQKAVFASRLPALSPRSVKRKRVNKTTPMVDTGELREATYKWTPANQDRDSATFGIPKGGPRKSIGAMHAKKSGSRPKRDVVPSWRKAERDQFIEILRKYLMKRHGT